MTAGTHITTKGYGIYTLPSAFKSSFTNERTVELYEIELVMCADCISKVNNKDYILTSPHIIFAHPGQKRCTKGDFTAKYIHFCCFDEILIENYFKSLPSVIPITSVSELSMLFDSYFRLLSQSEAKSTSRQDNGLILTSRMYEIISTISHSFYTCTNNDVESIKHRKTIDYAVKYIEDNFSEKILLDDIASHCHFSPSHLHRVFKKHMGITPCEYIVRVRLNNAKLMLLTTDKTISDIAFECGFDSQSYMNNVFKKHLGITPLKLRASSSKYLI